LVWDDVKRIVQTKMEDEVLPEIEDCIQAWQEADPMVEGEVKLGFTLGNYGLDTVEILDASRDIPGGPMTCVGAAVWETTDWPVMTDGQMNYRVRLRFDESGVYSVPTNE